MRLAPVIDIVALAIFALLARAAHPPFTFQGVLDAFWPWAVGALVGWAIISFGKPRTLFKEGLLVWPCAVVVGMGLWAAVNGNLPHISFLIVASVMSAVLMFGWRALATWRGLHL
ncbi:membrane protein [Corynebacterium phocae]|uniref:Membrane protein n=1 Tax=Corynebacterium phocae TaxID=161895 RepID=A0A1L7D5H0_9CORY|nr:DUF3054 domain-containing protein [Corynebacterium phocae]APT93389.1 membrane protein [Corynebacterium phocae]KAA8721731.1 DUF3054 domain-containing protein [Corynebacterium phocae]